MKMREKRVRSFDLTRQEVEEALKEAVCRKHRVLKDATLAEVSFDIDHRGSGEEDLGGATVSFTMESADGDEAPAGNAT